MHFSVEYTFISFQILDNMLLEMQIKVRRMQILSKPDLQFQLVN